MEPGGASGKKRSTSFQQPSVGSQKPHFDLLLVLVPQCSSLGHTNTITLVPLLRLD